ncbi:MAG: 4Fe-4S binding protein [Thermoleophilia bacterium]|jgi:polyferredoxin
MEQQIHGVTAGSFEPAAEQGRYGAIGRMLRWRLYPGLFHWPLYVALAILIYFAFAPGQRGEGNLATEVVWRLWWPLLPFVLLLAGRIWCGVCPFGGAADAAGRLVGKRPAPPSFFRKAGPWLGAASVFAFGIAFLALGLESNSGATGIILIAMTLLAAGLSLMYRGRTFCRYLCPVGMISRVYSFFSWSRPQGSSDRQAVKSCPVGLSTVSLRQPSQCHLCGACTEVHAPGGITTRFTPGGMRKPQAREFGRPEATLSLLLLGLMAADSVRMTSLFARYQQTALPVFSYNYRLTVVAGVTALAGLVLAAQLLISRLGVERHGWSPAFARASFTLLPLTLGVFLSLALQHLWSGALPSLQTILVESRLTDWSGHMPPANVYFTSLPLKAIQFTMLGAGLFLSLKVAGAEPWEKSFAEGPRPAGDVRMSGAWTRRAIVLMAAAGFGFLFYLPMSGAC